MTSERWERITEIFQAAADLTAGSRRRYLDQACSDDSDLRAQVESMISSDTADTRMARAVRQAASVMDPAALIPSQTRFGVWRVVESIGSGGMGTVYKVVRDDGTFEMEAALKVLHFASPQLRLRFRQERQILARLEHPNIARLLDGGETASGQSYLVLEYVAGETLLDFAHRNKLSRDQRLRLFLRICDAVQYLHRNLIVHRDLKPGNIMVTADGTPKLLDFGIAKLLDDDASLTQSGLFALTPQYASPEQVRGLPVNTASDVYSLGMVLYELLSGKRPYEVHSFAPVEVDRAVWESEIPRPRLGDDLDNILLMALRREPERRYASVEQFARDIERSMSDQPVTARPDTLRYRAGKYIRRNRLPLVAAAVVLASLSAGIVVSRREAERAQRRFQQSRQYANAILNDFYPRIQLIVGSTEARKFLVETTAKHLNDLAADASGDPDLAFDLANGFRLIGAVVGGGDTAGVGDREAALRSYRRAVDLSEMALRGGVGRRRVLELQSSSHIDIGAAHAAAGRDDLARHHYRLAEDAATELNDPSLLTSARDRVGDLLLYDGEAEMALVQYRRSRTELPRSRKITSWHRQVHAFRDLGRIEEARLLSLEAVAEAEALVARRPDSYYRIGTLVVSEIQCSAVHAESGDRAAAVRYLRRVVQRMRTLMDTDRTDAMVPGNVAMAAMWLGEAIPWASRSDWNGMARLYTDAAARMPSAPTEARNRFELSQLSAGRGQVLALMGDVAGGTAALDYSLRLARELARSPGAKLEHRMWLAELLLRKSLKGEAAQVISDDVERLPKLARLHALWRRVGGGEPPN